MLKNEVVEKIKVVITENNNCCDLRTIIRNVANGNLRLSPRCLSNHLRPLICKGIIKRKYTTYGKPVLYL